jgi:hypothetical protein
MHRAATALLLVLAVLASGCTGGASSAGDFEGEEKRVADVVERLQSAGEAGDAEEICDAVLAKALRDRIRATGSDCAAELDKALTDADDFDLEVEDVTINGTTATVRVKGRDGDRDRVRELELVREGEDWRAASLGS